jgi:hypothetical protein
MDGWMDGWMDECWRMDVWMDIKTKPTQKTIHVDGLIRKKFGYQ